MAAAHQSKYSNCLSNITQAHVVSGLNKTRDSFAVTGSHETNFCGKIGGGESKVDTKLLFDETSNQKDNSFNRDEITTQAKHEYEFKAN